MINIVLFQPEIPPNTGNIIRTCMASNCKLHLIKPLGFKLDDTSFKRAGLDYFKKFEFDVYENFEDFKNKCKPEHVYLITRFGDKTYNEFDYSDVNQDYYFIFGSETHGLPDDIHNEFKDYRLRIPMDINARCLNLSNTVAIIVYEALRQQNFHGLSLTNQIDG